MSIPDLLIEQLLLGELPPTKATEVRRRLEDAGELDRLDTLRADNAQILTNYPPRVIAAQVSVAARPAPRRRAWLAIPALAAAAALFVAVQPGPITTEPGERPLYDGIKSDPAARSALLIYRLNQDKPLADGAQVQPGDQVQVSYNLYAEHLTYGGIFSVDGNGTVTRHHVGTMDPEGRQTLPRSFELDDAPEFERFYLIADDQPIDTAAIENALSQGKDVQPPAGGLIDTFTLNKE
ncbi:MAG: hypothetical protein ACI8RZ_002434 [Myxococcota bacterium]